MFGLYVLSYFLLLDENTGIYPWSKWLVHSAHRWMEGEVENNELIEYLPIYLIFHPIFPFLSGILDSRFIFSVFQT